jgi:hypothetical protein
MRQPAGKVRGLTTFVHFPPSRQLVRVASILLDTLIST